MTHEINTTYSDSPTFSGDPSNILKENRKEKNTSNNFSITRAGISFNENKNARRSATTESNIRVGSFCTGFGGLDIGICKALENVLPKGVGIEHAFLVEREAFPLETMCIRKQFEQSNFETPVFSDLLNFPYDKFREKVDIVVGGIPCQSVSTAGRRQTDRDDRFLFDVFCEGMSELQPDIIFIENVRGLLTAERSNGKSVLRQFLQDLENLGYTVEDSAGEPLCEISSAEETGAPFLRERVFIMAYREGSRLLRLWERCSQERREEPVRFSGSLCEVFPRRPAESPCELEPPKLIPKANNRNGKNLYKITKPTTNILNAIQQRMREDKRFLQQQESNVGPQHAQNGSDRVSENIQNERQGVVVAEGGGQVYPSINLEVRRELLTNYQLNPLWVARHFGITLESFLIDYKNFCNIESTELLTSIPTINNFIWSEIGTYQGDYIKMFGNAVVWTTAYKATLLLLKRINAFKNLNLN